jgi:hypothetical protein
MTLLFAVGTFSFEFFPCSYPCKVLRACIVVFLFLF